MAPKKPWENSTLIPPIINHKQVAEKFPANHKGGPNSQIMKTYYPPEKLQKLKQNVVQNNAKKAYRYIKLKQPISNAAIMQNVNQNISKAMQKLAQRNQGNGFISKVSIHGSKVPYGGTNNQASSIKFPSNFESKVKPNKENDIFGQYNLESSCIKNKTKILDQAFQRIENNGFQSNIKKKQNNQSNYPKH